MLVGGTGGGQDRKDPRKGPPLLERDAAMPEPGAGDESEFLRGGEPLDPPFQLKGTAPGSDPAGPGEGHRAAGAGEFGRGARPGRVETPDDILGGAGVQRPIAATKDIDEGHLCFPGTDTRTQKAHRAAGSVAGRRWRAPLIT